ncbi:MAG: hypothetical protein VXZ34_04345, partial [Candidatus Thermoplasmatota archaeon]|nr:hypothetical protein [Candidatus Thermoplasmatota archaeon]
TGAGCLLQELINPEPQTVVFYVVILALLFYARGRSGRRSDDYQKDDFPDVFDEAAGLDEDDDDLPAPVLAQDDEDDELELLDELDDL